MLKNWRYTFPIFLSVSIGSTLIFYVPPLIVANLISNSNLSLATAWPAVLWFGASWMTGEMLWRAALLLMAEFESKAIQRLYKEALDTLLEKELSFYANHFTGTVTKNILAYARRFESFFDTLTFEIVASLIPALFAALVLAFISPWLSVALIGMMTLGILLVNPLIRRRLKLVQAREDAHASMAGHVADVITNIAAIKSFGNEDVERTAHAAKVDDFIVKAKKSWHYQTTHIDMVISPIYVATNVLGLAIVLSLSTDSATQAALFIAFNYFLNITRFLWSFNNVYRRLEEAITDASLFVAYTMTPPKVMDAPQAQSLVITKGAIAFHNMSFTHTEDTDGLFRKFSLEIPAGQKIGLVGHSGAGKSTIVGLLLRFMNIDDGKIMIDDQDISKITQQSLHQQIAYVPQDPLMFHRSIRDNIAYGKPGATEEEIRHAAKQAHALDFIEKLPEGFNTLVGERGIKLSGGQRQRVAIARAIVKDAPILVLDEATSALDSESEKLIQDALAKLMEGRTSIVIAHRLSTIAKLDRIVVLEDGNIIEDGSHAQLLQHPSGVYAKLWTHQSGGFIED